MGHHHECHGVMLSPAGCFMDTMESHSECVGAVMGTTVSHHGATGCGCGCKESASVGVEGCHMGSVGAVGVTANTLSSGQKCAAF